MAGEKKLSVLLKSMKPLLQKEEYVFCFYAIEKDYDYLELKPICIFYEEEGLTLILQKDKADAKNIPYESVFRMITLSVHSSLEAVGFLAAITSALAAKGMSVNPISAYHHDHLFIPSSRANECMEILERISNESA